MIRDIVIAGGSGLLGRALQARLQRDGQAVRILTRRRRAGEPHDVAWTPDGTAGTWADALNGADAVINLAGEGIADARWTESRKRALRDSRLLATRSLVAAMRRLTEPPTVFVSGSAVGYYGPHDDELVTESTSPGTDFLSQLAVEWEREAQAASDLTRVALVRTGLVLAQRGGALAKMLLPFKLGLGGRFGSGGQYMPWIHVDDWVSHVLWLLADTAASGAFNASAPNPVTNAEFTQTLASTLHRPAVVPVPAFALRLAVGELASALLTGQRAIPARAMQMGFAFRFTQLEPALHELIR